MDVNSSHALFCVPLTIANSNLVMHFSFLCGYSQLAPNISMGMTTEIEHALSFRLASLGNPVSS